MSQFSQQGRGIALAVVVGVGTWPLLLWWGHGHSHGVVGMGVCRGLHYCCGGLGTCCLSGSCRVGSAAGASGVGGHLLLLQLMGG